MLVVEVPRWRVLNNLLFLQVSIEGINPNLRDRLPVLQETVVRADRDEEIAVRAHAHFEPGMEIRCPSFLRKNLHSFFVGNCGYAVGFFDDWTVAKILAYPCSVDPILRPPVYQHAWAKGPTEVQKRRFVVIVSPWEVRPGDVREWKSGCHLEESLSGEESSTK